MYIQADQIFTKQSTLFYLVQTFKENEVGDEGAKGIVRNCNNTKVLTI